MQIKHASVPVEDQDKALHFYTAILGFKTCADVSMGDFRWLTVSSDSSPAELVLEPIGFPPTRIYQKARYDAGIPAVALVSPDINAEFHRLKERGVVFRGEPQPMGPIISVVFEDGCGNLVHLVQPVA